eukprot:m.418082 g.418082  ORF g.418082 m.418082 type:complete len:148 (+) comp20184_c0_seq26:4742-5185(+)
MVCKRNIPFSPLFAPLLSYSFEKRLDQRISARLEAMGASKQPPEMSELKSRLEQAIVTLREVEQRESNSVSVAEAEQQAHQAQMAALRAELKQQRETVQSTFMLVEQLQLQLASARQDEAEPVRMRKQRSVQPKASDHRISKVCTVM